MAVLVAVGPALGCFDPTLPEIACSASGSCPEGQICDVDLMCRATPTSIDPPTESDGARLLEGGAPFFDVAPIREQGFVLATGRTEVRFYRVDGNDVLSGPFYSGIEVVGEIDFLSVEPRSAENFYLTVHDQDGLHYWIVDASTYLAALPTDVTGDITRIATSGVDLGLADPAHLGVSYFDSADRQLHFIDAPQGERMINANIPGYSSVLYRSNPVVLYEQDGETAYWLPLPSETSKLMSPEYATMALGGRSLDFAVGIGTDGGGHLYIFYSSSGSFGADNNFDMGIDTIRAPEVVEGLKKRLAANCSRKSRSRIAAPSRDEASSTLRGRHCALETARSGTQRSPRPSRLRPATTTMSVTANGWRTKARRTDTSPCGKTFAMANWASISGF